MGVVKVQSGQSGGFVGSLESCRASGRARIWPGRSVRSRSYEHRPVAVITKASTPLRLSCCGRSGWNGKFHFHARRPSCTWKIWHESADFHQWWKSSAASAWKAVSKPKQWVNANTVVKGVVIMQYILWIPQSCAVKPKTTFLILLLVDFWPLLIAKSVLNSFLSFPSFYNSVCSLLPTSTVTTTNPVLHTFCACLCLTFNAHWALLHWNNTCMQICRYSFYIALH